MSKILGLAFAALVTLGLTEYGVLKGLPGPISFVVVLAAVFGTLYVTFKL